MLDFSLTDEQMSAAEMVKDFAEREVARRVTDALHASTADAVAAAHRDAELMAPRRRRGTGLTRLFH